MGTIKTSTIYTEIPVSERLPEANQEVFANLEWMSGKKIIAGLKKVKEDDCDWRTADDNSEISYSLNVVSWLEKKEDQVVMDKLDFENIITNAMQMGNNYATTELLWDKTWLEFKELYINNLLKQ